MGISYSREQRDNAVKRGKDLFACGVRQAKGQGLFEFEGPMGWRLGHALVLFCNLVHTGKTPAEAFAAVEWPERDAKMGEQAR